MPRHVAIPFTPDAAYNEQNWDMRQLLILYERKADVVRRTFKLSRDVDSWHCVTESEYGVLRIDVVKTEPQDKILRNLVMDGNRFVCSVY